MTGLREKALEAWRAKKEQDERSRALSAEMDAEREREYCRKLSDRFFGVEPDAIEGDLAKRSGVVVIDGLRLKRDGSAFRLLGKCPKCGGETWSSSEVHSLEGLGCVIETWEPSPFHECPREQVPAPEPETDEQRVLRLVEELHNYLHGEC